jgi:GNAT superfamily N-acetyltransferase
MKEWVEHPDMKIIREESTSYVLNDALLLRTPTEEHIEQDYDFDTMVLGRKHDFNDYDEEVFFKLVHKLSDLDELENETLSVKPFEFKEVSDFINLCYKDINVSEDEVMSWYKSPYYKESHWLWLCDNHRKVGLGIADVDESIGEVSLEWIQIHPDYHHLGYGKKLIKELLNRSKSYNFVTVSGKEETARSLYLSCGFSDEKKWYIYRKKSL